MVRYLIEKLSMFPQLWRGPITFRTESSLAVGKPRELVNGGRTKGGVVSECCVGCLVSTWKGERNGVAPND